MKYLLVGLFCIPFCGAVFANSGSTLESGWEKDESFKSAVEKVALLRISLGDFKNKLSRLDHRAKDSNDGELDQSYKEVRTEMVKVIQDIDYSTAKITRTLKSLYAQKLGIQNSLAVLQETRHHLEIGKKYLNQLLLLLYKMDREIYDDGNEIDSLKLFVKSDAIPQLLVGDDTIRILLVQIKDLMKKATTQEQKKSETIDRLLTLKSQSQKSLDYYQSEIRKLEQKKEYLISFMKLYNEKKIGTELASGFSMEEEELHNKINALVENIVQKKYLKGDHLPEKIQDFMKGSDGSGNETAPVAWPAYPVRQILTIFKDPNFEKEYGFKNLSLKLAVEQGTPVYAMRDGIVYNIDSASGSISWLSILHTDGYVSTYAYLNSIYVNPGDIVKRGQVIAQSGGEPGTQGAGFISKGENLTFSLFKDGVAIDPLTVLDLSVVQDKEKVLPEEYRLKYFNDQYVRPIDVSNLALLKGDTVDDRAQTFLNSYAVGAYRNVAFWDQVVKGTNIDRDMVICIGFAESTLGKFLATENNIGNVGNNDRGDRIAYNNPYNGARVIPLTLNNQYLGNYHTIKQLSRYGNNEGKIYASSPINWQTNVQKCLSKIKGFYIPEDYPFRTGPNPFKSLDTNDSLSLKKDHTAIMSGSVMTKKNGITLTDN